MNEHRRLRDPDANFINPPLRLLTPQTRNLPRHPTQHPIATNDTTLPFGGVGQSLLLLHSDLKLINPANQLLSTRTATRLPAMASEGERDPKS